ncbi:MAG: tetratricopeptide repeat protein [Planctomycetaceae bacterium]|nr:tetratricopeptide repeat protein [Planctomycetaceae bacterium]
MKRTLLGIVGGAAGLLLLLAAFRVAAAFYEPHRPPIPMLAEHQASLAATMAQTKRMELAFELARRAIETNPDSAGAHHTLAVLYAQANQPLEAMVEYRQAIRCQPDLLEARIDLGILLGQAGRLDEAAEQFRAAGDDPDARYNLEITERAIQEQKRRRRP